MKGRATVIAPSNIAFIKYWGTRDVSETLPYNRSLSMTLSRCTTTTTARVLEDSDRDMVFVGSDSSQLHPAAEAFSRGVAEHLDRLRAWAKLDCKFRIGTVNNFPMGTGIASSASGFAALTLAVIAALDRQVSPEKASILARLSGSGSAARSVMGGYVEWPVHEDGSAAAIADAHHWDLRDLIAIVDESEKEVSSKQGHRLAPSSPYFELRLQLLEDRLERVRRSILDRDFASLAPVVEEEAVDLHLIAMSSRPPVFYWQPGTLKVLKLIRDLRCDGVEVCATMDAGANVHAICTSSAEPMVAEALESISEVHHVIPDGVGQGPKITDKHLL